MKTACIAIILLLSVLVRVKVLTNLGKSMDGKSLDVVTEKLIHLKSLFPDIFAEGKIDLQRLKEILGEEVFVQNEHYELSWAGKSDARKEIQKQTTATLTPDRSGSVNFGSTQNVFIEGENLEVLRVLQKSYFGKIKMIYIDPPYNTGNDSFVYPDDYSERSDEFNKRTGITDENGFLNKQDLWQKNNKENGRFHSVWLSMMYPRLYLARNLLREDGVIFISIDDNEASNLKLICDEVFGEENFIGQIVWKKKTNGNNMGYIPPVHDFILSYSKQKNSLVEDEFGIPISQEHINKHYSNPDNDPRGLWTTMDLSANHKGPHFPIKNPSNGEIHYPSDGRYWVFNEAEVKKRISEGRIIFGKSGNGKPVQKAFLTDRKQRRIKAESWWDKHGLNEDGTKELTSLFGIPKIFVHSKPSITIRNLVNVATEISSSDLILDFFAGSGTTAQAVIELNEEDGGNRQFICVQMPEVLEENSEAHKAGYKTIADITKARISKVIEKITTERESKLELETRQPLGFNAYKLAPSNFKIWRSDIQGKDAILKQLEVFQSSEKSDSPQEDMLTELLLKTGLGLGVKYFQEQSFYKVGNLWICFEKFQSEMKEQILQGNVQKVIFLNSCFASDAELSNLQLELKENEINLVII